MTHFAFYVRKFLGRSIYLTIAIIMVSCGGGTPNINMEQQIKVDFLEVKPTAAIIEQKYPGSVEGSVNVEIKSQVSGYLDFIYVNEGDYVKKGQLLFKIKSDVFSEQVNNSKAALTASIAAQNNAKLEIEKLKPLVIGKVVSEMQLKTAEANYESATAQVAQAKASLGSSQINAAFCLIKAPVSGYIGRIPNRIGNLVTPGDGTPLTTLSDIDKIFVYFSLSEADFINLRKDDEADKEINTVELIMANGAIYEHKGNLETASGNIDQTTGSIAMKATFPNPNKLLRSGGSARIVLKKLLRGVISIPMACVKDIQDKYFVFVLTGKDKVSMQPIEICGRTDNNYIVKKGLNFGDKIAVNSIDLLNESVVITPRVVAGK
jgi:RND family efflux transporter, MFP subunit